SATPTTLDYDLAGNLVSDGTYFLQYDGFNRLVQVNAVGTATLNANGEITGGSPGDVVVQFVYDGLGRLTRTVRPDRTEDHYYDGVRRIHTDVTIDTTTTTDRQYVYGPDYVDEFVAQIDSAGAVFYMLQDGNYNVVALIDASGTVVEQYAYRPYGSLVAVDSLGTAPVNTAGHQGLFYERLGGQGLAVGATGFYYNRNRFYSPALGRFLQRDPNETAMPLLTAMGMNGQTLANLFGAFDPEMHFADGMNLYLYLGANPLNGFDPLGLFDPFEDVDEAIADVASRYDVMGAAMGTVQEGVRWGLRLVAFYTQWAFAWDEVVWDRDEAILFDLVTAGFFARACFEAGTLVTLEGGAMEPIECMGVGKRVMSWPAKPGAPAAESVVDPAKWRVIRLEANDAKRGTIAICLLRDLTWVRSARAEPGRRVRLAVEEMGIHGWAEVCSVEPCPAEAAGPITGLVTGTFQTEKAKLVNVYVDPLTEPIGATASHPFYSLDRNAWVGAGSLRAGERVRTSDGAASINHIEVCTTPDVVYNLEVQQTHTYFVSKARVWVHNGCALSEGAQKRFDNAKKGGQLEKTQFPALRRGKDVRIGQSHYDALQKFPETDPSWEYGWCRWIGDQFVFVPGGYRPLR
ncbi:MAG: hypothetical protein JXA69_17645, partial [Phycisphaerae bacterium]|nr:hypothetical protein [Phycisphaerae bacterium]